MSIVAEVAQDLRDTFALGMLRTQMWPSETDARRFRDVWCTGRERLETNAWNDEDAVAYWWLVKSNGSTVTVTERDEVLRGTLVPGLVQNRS